MAGNPRKFSEKIAIQQRKLNEEQNAFQSIISEVSRITRGDMVTEDPNLCPPNSGGWPRPGGSLPNVYDLAQQPQTMPPVDQMAMYAGQWPGPSGGGGGGMENARMTMAHPRERSPGAGVHGHHSHTYHPYRAVSPHNISPRNVSPSRQLSPEIGQQPPQQYGGYLVPPQDTSWRRTHSDPGIHQSVMHPTMPGVQQSTPSPSGNASSSNSPVGEMPQGALSGTCYLDPKGNVNAVHVRPRSCDNVPHLPNINIQPSEPVAGPQISISNNTGSLPDLPSSLLPGHMQAQKMEDVLGSQPPPSYSQAGNFSGNQSHPAAVASVANNALQQRHSIQLPVQYSQGAMGGGQKYVYAGAGHQNFFQGSHQQSYPPESPRSASGSPNDGIPVGHQSESPAASPQMAQPQSPGSPYCSLQTQMQNINIVDPQNQSTFANQQQQGYYGGNVSGSCYGSQPASSSNYQQYSAMGAPQMQMSQQQIYQALVMQQQQQQHQQQQQQQQQQHQQHNQQQQQLQHQQHQQQRHQQHHQQQQQQQQHYHQQGVGMQQHQGYMQQPSSPQSGQIPNIIFTGTDGSICGGAARRNINGGGLYVDVDPTVELLSSDLRMSLDPVDLESLHGLGNEQGLHIDAASEDELRRDRV